MTDEEKSEIRHNINNPLTILVLSLSLAKKDRKLLNIDDLLEQCKRISDYTNKEL